MQLIPAYGRDYKSKKALLVDWDSKKDFMICDMSSKDDGRYINKSDAQKSGIKTVNIRYGNLRKIAVVTV